MIMLKEHTQNQGPVKQYARVKPIEKYIVYNTVISTKPPRLSAQLKIHTSFHTSLLTN